jgi:hypothetical protein
MSENIKILKNIKKSKILKNKLIIENNDNNDEYNKSSVDNNFRNIKKIKNKNLKISVDSNKFINLKKKINSNDEKLITFNDFTSKEKDYYNVLFNFYSSLTNEELNTIYNIVNEKSISLRRFEWFAVRYSYFYKTSINVNNRFIESRVFVHISYKGHLKTYHKIFFDIFRRSDKESNSRKFKFDIPGKNFIIITSISQLHVMRWMLTHGIIDYVIDNYDKIMEKEDEVDLYYSNKSERSKRTKNSKIIKNCNNSTDGSNSKTGLIVVNRKIQFEV